MAKKTKIKLLKTLEVDISPLLFVEETLIHKGDHWTLKRIIGPSKGIELGEFYPPFVWLRLVITPTICRMELRLVEEGTEKFLWALDWNPNLTTQIGIPKIVLDLLELEEISLEKIKKI